MTTNIDQPDQPAGGKKRQNQGIPYTLRRIQIIDGIILTAIIAVFSQVQETNGKVDTLLAEKKAEEKAEALNPPVRQVRYETELNAVRKHVESVDGRVTELETSHRQR